MVGCAAGSMSSVETTYIIGASLRRAMLLFLVFLLGALWLIGMITTTTFGGGLHILLVIAVIFLLIRVIRGEPF
jgi:hypothetical protein